MKHKLGIVWFRQDLRLHDHEPLVRALEQCEAVIPVYLWDPRHFGQTHYGFLKTGAFRARFIWESLEDLQQQLQQLGSDLRVLQGRPEELLPALAASQGVEAVYFHQLVGQEEEHVSRAVEQALFARGISPNAYWGDTLYHLSDLPMPIATLPKVFTAFRKQVEKGVSVRPLFPRPTTIPSPSLVARHQLPDLADWIPSVPVPDPRQAWEIRGGERAGLARLKGYFWERDCLRHYVDTRNGLLGADYSSKFSAWLAQGCLSPRYVYQEIKRYEAERVKNKSTYWLFFELIWRDFFHFTAKKYGNALFWGLHAPRLPQAKWPQPSRQERSLLQKWILGETGYPFIDANMREIRQTGFMSNRGRQNVASFLIQDMGLNWRLGAEYFESQLIDYDVCSNWGNWNYLAGVGNDPRPNRYFNIVSQAKRYDPAGHYMKHWLPELAHLPARALHDLAFGDAPPSQAYPEPIVRLRSHS